MGWGSWNASSGFVNGSSVSKQHHGGATIFLLTIYRRSADCFIHSYRTSSYRAVNTSFLGYNNQSVIFYGTEVRVCSEIVINLWSRFLLEKLSLVGQGLLIIKASRSHTHTHTHTHTRFDSSGLLIGPTHRPLPDNTQHSKKIGGFRTYSHSGREAADPHLRLRGHWDRQREGLSWWR